MGVSIDIKLICRSCGKELYGVVIDDTVEVDLCKDCLDYYYEEGYNTAKKEEEK